MSWPAVVVEAEAVSMVVAGVEGSLAAEEEAEHVPL